jgi:hypothetical protein
VTSVWPYKPEGEPIEALEWLTDVQRTYGLEYRRRLRPTPRQEWEHTYVLDTITLQRAVQAARNLGDEEFFLPIWQERTYVGALAASTVTVPVDATYACYSEAGSLLVWEDETHYETRAILTINEGTITLESGLGANYTAAYVMPVRLATFAQPFAVTPSSSDTQWGEAEARFQAVVTEDLSEEEEPYPGYFTHKGQHVWYRKVEIIGDVRQSFEHRVDVLDSGAGDVSLLPNVEQPEQSSTVAWFLFGAEEVWETRLWLHKRKGRQKCFWVPSWSDDVTLLADINIDDTTMTVADLDFDQYGSFPMDLIIWESGWPKFTRVIGAASGSGGSQVLTLEGPSAIEIVAANVTQISTIRLVRFATDRIQIQHLVSSQARIMAQVVEVPDVPTDAGEGYTEHDESEQDSSPVYLFHFLQGAVNYRYTSVGVSVSASGQTWDPAVLIPGEFQNSGDVPKDRMSIQLPRDNLLATKFIDYPPEDITTLTIYRCDYDDESTPVVCWTGQVSRSVLDGNRLTLECDSDLVALGTRGPSMLCSRLCPYVLFGRGCNLDEDDFDEACVVTNVTGPTITLFAAPSQNYAGGCLKTPDGVKLTIYAHAGVSTTLTLLYKSKSMRDQMAAHPTGFTCYLYPGCNRSITECGQTFSNIGNFGGSFAIPAENPTNKVRG